MKNDTLFEAVGNIDDRFIEEAHREIHIKKNRFKPFVIAAAAVFCVAVPLPVAEAAGSEKAYQILSSVFPAAAQKFKPVQMSCIDNGIKMEVISADISGSMASVCLSMHDLEDDRLDETIDLFDSYCINIPFDYYGTCSFREYDADTKTAYFMVEIGRMDGKDITDSKITFSVGKLLTHKQHSERYIDEIALSTVTDAAETFKPERINGWGGTINEEIAGVNATILEKFQTEN